MRNMSDYRQRGGEREIGMRPRMDGRRASTRAEGVNTESKRRQRPQQQPGPDIAGRRIASLLR